MGRWRWLLGILGLAIYSSLATWSRSAYDDPYARGRLVVRLERPFEQLGPSRFGVVARSWTTDIQLGDANSVQDLTRSTMVIYEDGRLLGPAHSTHTDVAQIGMGRFSHWQGQGFGQGQGFAFSASDNSDPNSNRRTYWAVLPR